MHSHLKQGFWIIIVHGCVECDVSISLPNLLFSFQHKVSISLPLNFFLFIFRMHLMNKDVRFCWFFSSYIDQNNCTLHNNCCALLTHVVMMVYSSHNSVASIWSLFTMIITFMDHIEVIGAHKNVLVSFLFAHELCGTF